MNVYWSTDYKQFVQCESEEKLYGYRLWNTLLDMKAGVITQGSLLVCQSIYIFQSDWDIPISSSISVGLIPIVKGSAVFIGTERTIEMRLVDKKLGIYKPIEGEDPLRELCEVHMSLIRLATIEEIKTYNILKTV